jgi:hypothetical protein
VIAHVDSGEKAMPRIHGGHPMFARVCARLSPAMEQGVGDHRRRLLAGLAETGYRGRSRYRDEPSPTWTAYFSVSVVAPVAAFQ